jgi:hypothetical protein
MLKLIRVELVGNEQPVYINPDYVVAVEGIGGSAPPRCRIKTVTSDYQAAGTVDDFVQRFYRDVTAADR